MQLTVSPDGRRFVRPRDVAQVLQLNEKTVRRRIEAGKVRAVRTSAGHLMIPLDELVRLVEEMTQGANCGVCGTSIEDFGKILAEMGL